jgi:hypothetical protein
MTISLNGLFVEQAYFVQATTLGSDWTGATWVSMKNYNRLIIVADALSTGSVTGGVVTLNQATAVAGTSAKALAFTRMARSLDLTTAQTEVAQALTETAVTSNTWTIAATTAKRTRYVMEIDASTLDVAGGFDCVRFVSTALVNATGVVNYILYGARFSTAATITPMLD